MLDCLILGDSIAVGTAQQRPECVAYAKGGWNSWQWNKTFLHYNLNANVVIISLGANDHVGVKTEQELRKLRATINSSRVYWISPGMERKPVPQTAVEKIAREYGDVVLPRPKQHMSADGVHPTGQGYKLLAEQAK